MRKKMNPKKQLLFIYDSMCIGGSTTSLLNLLFELDYTKYDVDLLLYRSGGILFDYIPSEVRVLEPAQIPNKKVVKIFKFVFSIYFWKSLFASIKYEKRLGFNGQILNQMSANLFGRKVEKKYDVAVSYVEGLSNAYLATTKIEAAKKIGWVHCDYQKSGFFPELDKNVYKKLDCIVAVSPECQLRNNAVLKCKKSVFLPNILSKSSVVSKSQLEPLNDGAFDSFKNFDGYKLITVARLDNSSKALERVCYSARDLKKNNIKFLWLVIGEGSSRNELESLINEFNIEENLRLIGQRINPMPFIKHADIFVLSSRYEGKPMSITESMLLGTPCLVTNYTSAHEQIKNDYNGWIVENNDEAIAKKIISLLCNPTEIDCVSDHLKQYGEEMHNEIVLYEKLFDK